MSSRVYVTNGCKDGYRVRPRVAHYPKSNRIPCASGSVDP